MPSELIPDWQADPRVGAVMTTRAEGDLRSGSEARRAFEASIGVRGVWLHQVHGTRVVRVGPADVDRPSPHEADASVTSEPGVACIAQAADCLPILYAAPLGRAVGAAHAGWRGLAAGIAQATLGAVCEAAACEPADVRAWLGACIGPRRFEVGADVLQAFGADPREPGPRFVPQREGKWIADLPGLARDRLAALGVRHVSGGTWCTVEDASRFFSFRRDRGITGRMAAAVWIGR